MSFRAWLSVGLCAGVFASACSAGQCLNPQPDLPCDNGIATGNGGSGGLLTGSAGTSAGAGAPGSAGASAGGSAGSGAMLPEGGMGGEGPSEPSAGAGGAAEAGAGGEAGQLTH